jgi:hypothetical protein
MVLLSYNGWYILTNLTVGPDEPIEDLADGQRQVLSVLDKDLVHAGDERVCGRGCQAA